MMTNFRFTQTDFNLGKTFWPRYRGKRAGRLIKLRENCRRYPITVVHSSETKRTSLTSIFTRHRNIANCIRVATSKPIDVGKVLNRTNVPSFFVSNAMSLVPKIDELHCISKNVNLDCLCIVETWLQSHIHDNIVTLEGYNIIRRDRIEAIHGGVCMFIKDTLKFTVLENLQEVDFEALWIKILPSRLPRGYNSIVVGTIYPPSRANDQAMREYLIRCLSYIESHYCNCGVVITGDFNRLDTTRLQNSFKLKQIVNFPARGVATLDLVLTNINDFYDSPIKRPPLGLSDHLSIELQPRERCTMNRTKIKIKSRDLRPSKRAAMATYLQQVDVCSLIGAVDSCQEKV